MKLSLDYFRIGRIILLIVAVILVGQVLLAQRAPKAVPEPENKIKMKIFIEKTGEKNVFDKEFKNQKPVKSRSKLLNLVLVGL